MTTILENIQLSSHPPRMCVSAAVSTDSSGTYAITPDRKILSKLEQNAQFYRWMVFLFQFSALQTACLGQYTFL